MTKAPSLDRKTWMATLAKAPPARLAALMPDLPPHEVLRAPEIGAVMVQGRTGATGAPFNLGEMTVTRASVRLGCGTVGHAWVQGRDKAHARRAALADALLQTDAMPATLAGIIEPLQAEAASEKAARAAKAAGTKVEFFTMVRGDNA
jgi:alpha-D-ribose 1-methylphosphonate 5-triphosphate synthase subunit PhnG